MFNPLRVAAALGLDPRFAVNVAARSNPAVARAIPVAMEAGVLPSVAARMYSQPAPINPGIVNAVAARVNPQPAFAAPSAFDARVPAARPFPQVPAAAAPVAFDARVTANALPRLNPQAAFAAPVAFDAPPQVNGQPAPAPIARPGPLTNGNAVVPNAIPNIQPTQPRPTPYYTLPRPNVQPANIPPSSYYTNVATRIGPQFSQITPFSYYNNVARNPAANLNPSFGIPAQLASRFNALRPVISRINLPAPGPNAAASANPVGRDLSVAASNQVRPNPPLMSRPAPMGYNGPSSFRPSMPSNNPVGLSPVASAFLFGRFNPELAFPSQPGYFNPAVGRNRQTGVFNPSVGFSPPSYRPPVGLDPNAARLARLAKIRPEGAVGYDSSMNADTVVSGGDTPSYYNRYDYNHNGAGLYAVNAMMYEPLPYINGNGNGNDNGYSNGNGYTNGNGAINYNDPDSLSRLYTNAALEDAARYNQQNVELRKLARISGAPFVGVDPAPETTGYDAGYAPAQTSLRPNPSLARTAPGGYNGNGNGNGVSMNPQTARAGVSPYRNGASMISPYRNGASRMSQNQNGPSMMNSFFQNVRNFRTPVNGNGFQGNSPMNRYYGNIRGINPIRFFSNGANGVGSSMNSAPVGFDVNRGRAPASLRPNPNSARSAPFRANPNSARSVPVRSNSFTQMNRNAFRGYTPMNGYSGQARGFNPVRSYYNQANSRTPYLGRNFGQNPFSAFSFAARQRRK